MSNAESSRPLAAILLLLGLLFFISAVMFVERFTSQRHARHRVFLQAAPMLEDMRPVIRARKHFERILRRANPEMVFLERPATVTRNLADWLGEVPYEAPIPAELDSLVTVLKSLEYRWGFELIPIWEWRLDQVRARRRYLQDHADPAADTIRIQTYQRLHAMIERALRPFHPLEPLYGWHRPEVRTLLTVDAEFFSALFDSTLGRGNFQAQNASAVKRIRDQMAANADLRRFMVWYDATQVFRLAEALAADDSLEVVILPPEED